MTITNITHGLQAITAQQSNRRGYKWHLYVYFTDISPSSSHGVHRQMVAAGASCSAGSGAPLASQHLSPYSSPDTFQYDAGTARVKQAYKNNTPPEPAQKYLDNFFYRPNTTASTFPINIICITINHEQQHHRRCPLPTATSTSALPNFIYEEEEIGDIS